MQMNKNFSHYNKLIILIKKVKIKFNNNKIMITKEKIKNYYKRLIILRNSWAIATKSFW
jgi:hypothetical protein